MYSFKNDYSEGAHPAILQKLMETNMLQEEGYGYDSFTERAVRLIREQMNKPDADVHLLMGGTQTNLTAISAFLKPWEAVIAAETGHIFVNEAGAIEATGHKVITVPGTEGKLTCDAIHPVVAQLTDEHTVEPKLIYISNPTEIGTIYSKQELKSLRDYCTEHGLYLYVDGARLASALSAKDNDVTISELASMVDAFYIGGTKSGAMFGEALVICHKDLKQGFRMNMKQKGAMLAKSRLLGIQFSELFSNHLMYDLAEHANAMAERLQKGIEEQGFSFLAHSTTNQVFPILPHAYIEKLQEQFLFYVWEKIDDTHSAVRLITSWATDVKQVDAFLETLKAIRKEINITDSSVLV
ncbi:threonine aldolase family protein [Bacillus testis]|uniref:threonine aldolase family protein n=1 Tax=Bacillus testis TaxID=1622072 RepID=UPI00067E6798|nr:aminotransferase class I/II-fold pyridoxal phosphate-dependent enzyme [Bacillus testis]